MAKKTNKHSSGTFDFLVDNAAGLTMNAIADIMEEKYNYRKRGVPNPYRAAAIGVATGRLKSTSSLLKLGGFLGAMGSFDPVEIKSQNTKSCPKYQTPMNLNWEYDDIGYYSTIINDNKYAWRLNCEDGSSYGINPMDYETRDEYNDAIRKCQAELIDEAEEEFSDCRANYKSNDFPIDQNSRNSKYIIYRVSRLDNGSNDYYQSKGKSYCVGDTVTVPTSNGCTDAIIISVDEYEFPLLPKTLKEIDFTIE